MLGMSDLPSSEAGMLKYLSGGFLCGFLQINLTINSGVAAAAAAAIAAADADTIEGS